MAKENKPLMRNRKGWKGFVWLYPDWQRKVVLGGLWDAIKWEGGTKAPKSVEVDKMGKIIQKW